MKQFPCTICKGVANLITKYPSSLKLLGQPITGFPQNTHALNYNQLEKPAYLIMIISHIKLENLKGNKTDLDYQIT